MVLSVVVRNYAIIIVGTFILISFVMDIIAKVYSSCTIANNITSFIIRLRDVKISSYLILLLFILFLFVNSILSIGVAR